MRAQERLGRVLAQLGARLKRQHKHFVYELPNGQRFVTGKTPSDVRGELNAIADARKAAGIVRDPVAREGERRDRRKRQGRAGEAPWRSLGSTAISSAFLESGLVERQLRAQVADLEDALMNEARAHQAVRSALDDLRRDRLIHCALQLRVIWRTVRILLS